jgi:serine/threonine protein phosphatase PrpC
MEFKDCYDKPPEEQAITCAPDVTDEEISAGDFVLLACDGLWDVGGCACRNNVFVKVMSNEEAVEFVQERIQKSIQIQQIAVALVKEGLDRGSQDNITAVIVHLQ